jgi:hypothetical protein
LISPETPGEGTVGVTNLKTRKIFLWAAWQPDRRGACFLVHELTHYLQAVNRVPYDSSAELEPLAYQTEAKCHDLMDDPAAAEWARDRARVFQTELAAPH